jgi:chorismate synthase
VGAQKLGSADPRAVMERASARELAMRVALGAAARQPMESQGVALFAHVVELGGIPCGPAPELDSELKRPGRRSLEAAWLEQRDQSPFYCLGAEAEPRLVTAVDAAKQAGDTLGGIFEVIAFGLPIGLGSYLSGPERLTSRLAAALLSIPAMKGIEFGLGFESARRPGSQVHDAYAPAESVPAERRPLGHPFARLTNRSGGLEGGMTTGEPLWLRVAMKPISTLRRGLPSVDFESQAAVTATYQRSDVTAVPAASVAGEALLALCLACR